jgi:Fic family protein
VFCGESRLYSPHFMRRKILSLLLGGFEGKLTSGKWAKLAGCSSDTALRDLQDLVARGVLERDGAGGRSTGYRLVR